MSDVTPENIIAEYTAQGFQRVHVRRDHPHFQYFLHYHPKHVVLHVVEGELEIDFVGRKVVVHPGESIDIEAEQFHTTCIGPLGCTYVHAEREK